MKWYRLRHWLKKRVMVPNSPVTDLVGKMTRLAEKHREEKGQERNAKTRAGAPVPPLINRGIT